MKHKRVLILENGFLTSAGVYSLLFDHENLNIKNVDLADQIDMFQVIHRFQPDVIVTDENTLGDNLTELYQSLKDFPNMRVIVVKFGDLHLQVYEHEQILVEQVSDLLSAL